jgi:hypothetical protein
LGASEPTDATKTPNKKSHPDESGWPAPDITLVNFIEGIPGAVNNFLKDAEANYGPGPPWHPIDNLLIPQIFAAPDKFPKIAVNSSPAPSFFP